MNEIEFNYASVFSGIDGPGVAADAMNWNTVFTCELASFPRNVLKHHWPSAIHYENIITTNFTIHRGTIDVLCGGFPCQPFSLAGERKGTGDTRHLWPQMLRAIHEIQPRWIVAENVPGLVNWSKGLVFEQVQHDLEAAGYQTANFLIPAAGVNAPHLRYRLFIVAYAMRNGQQLRRPGQNRRTPEQSTYEQKEWQRFWNHYRRTGQPPIITNTNQRDEFDMGRGYAEKSASYSIHCNPGDNGDAADTDCSRCRKEQPQTEAEQPYTHGETRRISTDTCNPRCKRRQQFQNQAGNNEFINNNRAGNWYNFPTQPPLCGGNDGIRSGLYRYISDHSGGILTEKEINHIVQKTINQVRTNSIKAYGNAIVPAVILPFFEAIKQYETILNQ